MNSKKSSSSTELKTLNNNSSNRLSLDKSKKPAKEVDFALPPKEKKTKAVAVLDEIKEKPRKEEKKEAFLSPLAQAEQPGKKEPQTGQGSEQTAHSKESEKKTIFIKGPVTVKELAALIGIKPFQLIHHLMEMNIFASMTQLLDETVIQAVCNKLGIVIQTEKKERNLQSSVLSPPPKPKAKEAPPQPSSHIKPRAPVVTFMGHVDHGKTSLLDAIRQTRVAAEEAGGITQHIGAYTVEKEGRAITFIDTPGHEAFTAMRARGASITDIVVLVVAADDGVMPQTIEAINHARSAKVPIIVAINKIDLPGANPLKVKSQLQEIGLIPEEYGGNTIFCEVSATKKIGIDNLLDMILLQAEILELKADYEGNAKARVIESQIEKGRGPTATVIVQSGRLKVGDLILCGPYHGKVRALIDDRGKNIKEAFPSMPVKVLGLDGAPLPGEELVVEKDEKKLKEIVQERIESLKKAREESLAPKVTLENIFQAIEEGQKKTLNIVLKADVQGSLEALIGQLKKITSSKVDLDIIHSGVGSISESDILLAKASKGIVIGFNTKTDSVAASLAKREGVQIKLFSVIYELVDQIKEAMSGLLEPELRETIIGTAIVKKVFELSKYKVAGCLVQSGRIVRGGLARVLRAKQPIYDGEILSLKRFQDEVSEVRMGLECGIRLGNFNDYEIDDIIQCYQLEKIPQKL
ncbi:translation initiation factor IF-2 [Candidatus Methylacidiphilum infernorum]|uniref:Translation initiation factor IF-2 n=1 Tax=Candidatus Methylacidiphilum infernorum TaxID=511746 RepID=A0ABX7PWG3_9BACT|nr:translation initiation factor IF-2 [Candidatus Methylacidiphilum infernorum]QSR87350.1 translation initiation factor IF-2 [Candidatus Methylacidiphilum infernorum]